MAAAVVVGCGQSAGTGRASAWLSPTDGVVRLDRMRQRQTPGTQETARWGIRGGKGQDGLERKSGLEGIGPAKTADLY